jgi:hypothetical protein
MKNEKNAQNSNLEAARITINGLQYGVCTDSTLRPFDLVDYYENTKLLPKTLYDNVVYDSDEFTFEEKRGFYSFVLQNSDDKRLNVKEIMSIKHTVIVEDNPKVITEQEKTNVIKYLKLKKIPVTVTTYNIILKRYLYEGLDICDALEKSASSKKVRVR